MMRCIHALRMWVWGLILCANTCVADMYACESSMSWTSKISTFSYLEQCALIEFWADHATSLETCYTLSELSDIVAWCKEILQTDVTMHFAKICDLQELLQEIALLQDSADREVLLCRNIFTRAYTKVRHFIKKHKKILIIGAAVTVGVFAIGGGIALFSALAATDQKGQDPQGDAVTEDAFLAEEDPLYERPKESSQEEKKEEKPEEKKEDAKESASKSSSTYVLTQDEMYRIKEKLEEEAAKKTKASDKTAGSILQGGACFDIRL